MKIPVINAMKDINHPCEMIAEMYALAQIREDFRKDNYLFCGIDGNIGRAWKEASDVMGFSLEQCCPEGNEIEWVKSYNAIVTPIIIYSMNNQCSFYIMGEECGMSRGIGAHANLVLQDQNNLSLSLYNCCILV